MFQAVRSNTAASLSTRSTPARAPLTALTGNSRHNAALDARGADAGNRALPGAARTSATLRPSRVAVLQRKCACGGSAGVSGGCAECSEKKESELHRKAVGEADSAVAPPIVHQALRSPGQPLDRETRAWLEPRFGHDFGAVRLHTDATAAASARAVNAHAFTVGRDIVFASGQHAPRTSAGARLLAHELTHVVQQGGHAPSGRLEIGPARDSMERDADITAEAVMAGSPAAFAQKVSATRLQRLTPGGSEPDEIHDSMVEQFRREQGFPPGGVDASGKRVGPSDSEIKYQLLPKSLGKKFDCPWPADFASEDDAQWAMMCVSAPARPDKTCSLNEKHRAVLNDATTDARRRVQKAYGRMYMKGGPEYAQVVAGRIFDGTPPTAETIKTTLDNMKAILESGSLPFVGGTCADPLCDTTRSTPDTENAHAVAYESGPGNPVTICPRAFLSNYLHEFRRTVIHEVVHLAGIDIDPDVKERYCADYSCGAKCHDVTVADAWALFVDCLGGTLSQGAPAAATTPPAAASSAPSP
jgi:hypothetical protein